MLHAQYLKGTEDRKTSVFLPDLPWYLPVGADGRLAELQAEAFHGAVPVPPRLLPAFRPDIQNASLSRPIGSKTKIYLSNGSFPVSLFTIFLFPQTATPR